MSATQTRTNSVKFTKEQAATVLSSINRDYARENNRRQMFERKARTVSDRRGTGSSQAEAYAKLARDSAARMTLLEEAHKAVTRMVRS